MKLSFQFPPSRHSKYIPLSLPLGDDFDSDEEIRTASPRGVSTRRAIIGGYLFGIATVAIIAIAYVVLPKLIPRSGNLFEFYEQRVVFPGSISTARYFMRDTRIAELLSSPDKSSLEVGLLPDNGGQVFLDEVDRSQIALNVSMEASKSKSSSFAVSVFHQIHCLVSSGFIPVKKSRLG